MPIPGRMPTMTDALRTLVDLGVDIRTVLDVGVQSNTAPLMKIFPQVKHHLFEPVSSYLPNIRNQYQGMAYELHHMALSNKNGKVWNVCDSRDLSGNITHSYLSEKPLSKTESRYMVSCDEVLRSRMDTWARSRKDIQPPYLLKIDVDGHELSILEGSELTLPDCHIVIVEAPLATLLKRSSFLIDRGFVIFDIVDLCYYGGTLWQVDVIFVRKQVIQSNDRLKPMLVKKKLDRELWYPLSRVL